MTYRHRLVPRRKTRRHGGGKKIAVCFWGLTRSLKYTMPSIRSILDSLGTPTIFLHTYRVKGLYTNERAREKNIELNPEEWKDLNPDVYEIEDQDEVKQTLNVDSYRNSGDPWNNNYATLDNFILAMRSLNKVTELMLASKTNFTHVVFMRPDVVFKTPVKESYLSLAKKNTCVVPAFHSWGGYNDRFAICPRPVARIYGTRFQGLLEYSKEHLPHSETYLKHTLRNVHVRKVPICFHRVRATGEEFPDC